MVAQVKGPIPKSKTVPHFNGATDLRSEFSINSRSAPLYNREPITAVLSPCIRIFSATKTRRISASITTERISVSVDNTYKIALSTGKIFTSKTPALPLLNRGARRYFQEKSCNGNISALKKERTNSFEKKGKRKKSSNGSPGSNNSPKSRLNETVIKLDSGVTSRLERAADSRETISVFKKPCSNSPDTDFIRSAPATLSTHNVQQIKKSKQKIFFSDGTNVLKKGIIGVPPASPTPEHLENVQYVKCLADLRSKRKLDEKLLEIAKFRDEQKKKAVLDEKKARAVEEKRETAQLRVRQRQEIYALNQVMKELEERRFQQYVKEKTES